MRLIVFTSFLYTAALAFGCSGVDQVNNTGGTGGSAGSSTTSSTGGSSTSSGTAGSTSSTGGSNTGGGNTGGNNTGGNTTGGGGTGGTTTSTNTDTCVPSTTDGSKVGAACTGNDSDCPTGYICQSFDGITVTYHCAILCDADCQCPGNLKCQMFSDKGKTWKECTP